MREELGKIICYMEEAVKPYAKGEKTFKEAVDDWYKEFVGEDAYGEDVEEFDRAKDIYDHKLGLLGQFVMTKRMAGQGEDFATLIKYVKDATQEFEEALQNRGE